MKVRATRDGHYGGWYRLGPIIGDQGSFPGEVFEISDNTFPVLDMDGKPVMEKNEQGKIIVDPETHKPKVKMGTWFSPEWMEKVSDNEEITFNYPPFEIPIQYREMKVNKNGRATVVPQPGVASSINQAPLAV